MSSGLFLSTIISKDGVKLTYTLAQLMLMLTTDVLLCCFDYIRSDTQFVYNHLEIVLGLNRNLIL